MNKKIFAQLLGYSQNDLDKITQPYILETFGVEVDRCDTLEQYAEAIDVACLHKYFSKYWENDIKKWKYSGLALIDEVNSLKPRAVLDVGCGYNEFRGKINNLIGIDPYNDKADHEVGTLEYRTDQKFDVIMCLGSINFGSRDKILRRDRTMCGPVRRRRNNVLQGQPRSTTQQTRGQVDRVLCMERAFHHRIIRDVQPKSARHT